LLWKSRSNDLELRDCRGYGGASVLEGPIIGRELAMGFKLLLVLCGGGVGAVSRYLVGTMALKWCGPNFPWGTLTVNLGGCFLIGLLFALAGRVRFLTPEMHLFLVTGFLGALTTFSAFSMETINALRSGWVIQAMANVLINNTGALVVTFLGIWMGSSK
jgi:fluoride exporter